MNHRYNREDYRDPRTGMVVPDSALRIAIIQGVDPTTGLVTLEWTDYPGVRTGVAVSQASPGIFQLPPVGSLVLVALDGGYRAHILRYLPAGYGRQVADGDIWAVKSGELFLSSYLSSPLDQKQYPTPVLTGTSIYLNNTGDLIMSSAGGETWAIDNDEGLIFQKSLNYSISTEAGVIDFGLTRRRLSSRGSSPTIISTDGLPITSGQSLSALTEFRLRVVDQADMNSLTAPEVETNPLIELTLGRKVSDSGTLVKTGATHAAPGNDIIIQLKTSANQEFEFTVDSKGNVTMRCKGDLRVTTSGDADIEVGKTATIEAKDAVVVDAPSIKLGGSQSLVLSTFLDTFNSHTHIGSAPGSPTGPPVPVATSVQKTTKVVAG